MSWNIKTPGDYINGPLTVAGSATITGALTVGTAANFNGGALAGYLNGNLMFGSSGNTVNFFAQTSGFAFKENTGANNLLTISNAGVFGFLDGAGGTRMTLNSTGLGIGGSPRTKFDVLLSGTANTGGSLAPSLGLFTGPGLVPLIDGSRAGANVNIESNTAQGINVGASLMLGGRYADSSTASSGFAALFGGKATATTADISGYLAFYTSQSAVMNERMRIDSSGNVGVGVTPSAWGSSYKSVQTTLGAALAGATGNLVLAQNCYNDGTNWVNNRASTFSSRYDMNVAGNGFHAWYVYNSSFGTVGNTIPFTQAMTLDASGNLLVNTTSQILSAKVSLQTAGSRGYGFNDSTGGAGTKAIIFGSLGVEVGSVSITTLATTYNTLSDYRLKESVKPLSGGLVRVNALKPSIYKWKSNGSDGEGFIAHELADIVPAAVTGEKDAVNADGTISPQGVDLSKVIPILVAAIQELTARVQTLESR